MESKGLIFRKVDKEDKKIAGPLLNTLKKNTQLRFEHAKKELNRQAYQKELEKDINFDVTARIQKPLKPSLHVYTHAQEAIESAFISMGFDIVDGPHVEDDFHNFNALNIPDDHPARDMQDTFWLTIPGMLMRTHTSSVQIRTMKKNKPPLAIATTGRAYRNEATDASHDFMFMQTEILYVNKTASLSQLFGTIKTFLSTVFEHKDISIRTRPSYFPFTEPSIEVDMSCPFCTEGCSVCSQSTWIEIGGAGLVHPHVLQSGSIDPDIYQGFAFGFGLTRLVMLKYGINDIRLLHSNKVEFLQQFTSK
jgi:phenylalanyl-tRNA synthetase alpha chain